MQNCHFLNTWPENVSFEMVESSFTTQANEYNWFYSKTDYDYFKRWREYSKFFQKQKLESTYL